MDNSLLVSLSQQLAAYRSMDVIANNLANVSTPGYKRETAQIRGIYRRRCGPPKAKPVTQSVSFVKDAGILRDLSQGELTHTGAPLDVAINGNGYFHGADARRHALHPRRPFHRSTATASLSPRKAMRCRVMAAPSPSRPTTATSISRTDGTISSVVNGIINQLGKMQVVDFANDSALTKQGANLYSTTQAPTTRAPARCSRACWKAPTSSR